MSGLRDNTELLSNQHELVAAVLRLIGKSTELGLPMTAKALQGAAQVARHELAENYSAEVRP
jgi:hypothetical protein